MIKKKITLSLCLGIALSSVVMNFKAIDVIAADNGEEITIKSP